MVIISENDAEIELGNWNTKITKKLEVFYNPLMKFNRDCSVLLLTALGQKQMSIALPLSGSGVRGIRFLKELDPEIVKDIHFNDIKKDFAEQLKKNLALSGISDNLISEKVRIHNKDANLFIEESFGFDYIDIDPFGSPNPFLDSAIRRLSRSSILAVTATDTSALTGTYPLVSSRKYYSVPLKNFMMHEIGLRILARKVQLIGAQHDKSLVPVFSYAKDHYYRIFFRCEKGKKKVDDVLEQHKYFLYCEACMRMFVDEYNLHNCCAKKMKYAGPLWAGALFDRELVKNMRSSDYAKVIGKNEEDIKFFHLVTDEALSGIEMVGFFELPEIMKVYKIKESMKLNEIIEKLKEKGHLAVRTHMGKQGIKTDAGPKEIIDIFAHQL